MSNVRVIIVGDGESGLEYVPTALFYAKKMRAEGHTQGFSRSFYVDNVLLRVNLDDIGGDRVYIVPAACPTINYNGFLDTYPSYGPFGPPLAVQEAQENIEDLPRTRNGVFIEGAPMMYGMRKVPAYLAGTDPTPVLPPGYTLKAETYPKVSVARQTADDDFRRFFAEHKPTRYSGLMRRALQCTFATDTWLGALTYMSGTGESAVRKMLTNFTFGDSWGLVLAPDKDGSEGSHYFMIWISYGEVHWVPADICVHEVKMGVKTVYAPVIQNIYRTDAISLGVLPSLGGGACSAVIGWAFSYTEPKASTVIFGEADMHHNVRLATIDIVFADDGPKSITYSLGSKSVFWNHLRNDKNTQVVTSYGVFNPPDSAGSLNITFDVRNFPSAYIEDYEVANIPVHVYYVPDKDTPEIVGYSYSRFDGETKTTPAPQSSTEAFDLGGPTSLTEASYIRWGFTMNGTGLPSMGGARTGVEVKFERGDILTTDEGHMAAPSYPYGGVGTYLLYFYYVATAYRNGVPWANLYFEVNRPATPLIVYRKYSVISGGGDTILSTCTLPVDDREAAILYTAKSTAALSEVTTYETFVACWRKPGVHQQAAYNAGVGYVLNKGSIAAAPYPGLPSDEQIEATRRHYEYAVGGVVTLGPVNPTYTDEPFTGDILWPWAASASGYTWTLQTSGVYRLGTTSLSASPLPTENKSHTGKSVTTTTIYGAHEPIQLDSSVWGAWLTPVWDADDNWAVSHAAAAFVPAFVMYDKLPKKAVVKMDDEEYTPENGLTSWLGVV